MSAKPLVIAAMLLETAQVSIPFGSRKPGAPVPKAPIERAGPQWAATCSDDDPWDKPAPPVRIHANTYDVGTCGITAILIVGEQGDILIDGGPANAAPLIAENIASLGVNLRNIRYILFTHEHFDHVGGIAELQQRSGASLLSSAPAARVMASGEPASDDPQFGVVKAFPAARVERIVHDGEQILIGDIMVEAIATPGHTPGAMSWRWNSCEGAVCRTIVYADSLTPISSDSYRFSAHPDVVAAFRSSIAKIADSPCDILVTPHPSASGMRERFAAGKPLLDTNSCKTYAASRTQLLDQRLAKEAEGAKAK